MSVPVVPVLAKFLNCFGTRQRPLPLPAKQIRIETQLLAPLANRQLGRTLIPALSGWCLIDVVAFVFTYATLGC